MTSPCLTELPPRLSNVALAGALLGLAPLWLLTNACGLSGERASTGECPADEICSPATPNGLVFEGSGPSGTFLATTTIAPTAVGGTQTIRVEALGGDVLPAFRAASDDEEILTVGATDGATVSVEGVRAGSAALRILDVTDGDTLLDRATLRAEVVTAAEVAPLTDVISAVASDRPGLAFEPGRHALAVHLLDADGELVVDETMTVSRDEAPLTPTSAIDGFDVDVPAGGASLDVTVGRGDVFQAAVAVADAPDGVAFATWLLAEDGGALEVASGDLICAIGTAGEAWWYASSAPEASATVDGMPMALGGLGDEPALAWQCGSLPELAPGDAVLSVTIAGATGTIDVRVIERAGSASAPLRSTASAPIRGRHFSLGERARGR